MYTVKEISEILGVRYQTVYNHIDKNKEELEPYVKKVKGIQHITDPGLLILKHSLGIF